MLGGALRNARYWKVNKQQKKRGRKVNAVKPSQKKVVEPVFYSIREDIDEIDFQ